VLKDSATEIVRAPDSNIKGDNRSVAFVFRNVNPKPSIPETIRNMVTDPQKLQPLPPSGTRDPDLEWNIGTEEKSIGGLQ